MLIQKKKKKIHLKKRKHYVQVKEKKKALCTSKIHSG